MKYDSTNDFPIKIFADFIKGPPLHFPSILFPLLPVPTNKG